MDIIKCMWTCSLSNRDLVINEILKIVERGYAAVALYCIFIFVCATFVLYRHKVVIEKKEKGEQKVKR